MPAEERTDRRRSEAAAALLARHRARAQGRARRDRGAPQAAPGLADDARDAGAAGATTRGRRSATTAASSCSRRRRSSPACPPWLPPLPKGAAGEPARVRALARLAGEPADRARDGEPPLGGVLRPRHRPHARGLRLPGRAADAPGTARLAGGRVHRTRGWSVEEAAPADRHERDLPAVVARHAGAAREGRREQAARARPAGPARSGAGPRRRAHGRGLLSAKMGGPSVFPPQPRERHDRGRLRAAATGRSSDGEDRYRRGLYTFAKRTAPYAMFGTFDAPERRGLRGAPRGVEHAAAGAHDAQRRGAARGGAAVWRSERSSTTGRPKSASRSCSAAASRGRRRAEEAALIATVLRGAAASGSPTIRSAPHAVGGTGPGTAAERAAWTATARAILNLDEVVTKE